MEFNCSIAKLEFWPLLSCLDTVSRLINICKKTDCQKFSSNEGYI